MIDGKQNEVRAVRNQGRWVDQDGRRDTEIILKELEKRPEPTNVVRLEKKDRF